MLSGHTDVVPVDGQDWSSDPFVATERDGRLHGRGTTDMKGFVAAVLALVPEMLERPLAAPIHLALSYDEEVGCKGAVRLLDHLERRLPAMPFGCLVGEPTGMRVANGHKGKAGYECSDHRPGQPLGAQSSGRQRDRDRRRDHRPPAPAQSRVPRARAVRRRASSRRTAP